MCRPTRRYSMSLVLLLLAVVSLAVSVCSADNRDILIAVDCSGSMGNLPPGGGIVSKLDIVKCMVNPKRDDCPDEVVKPFATGGIIRQLGAKATGKSELLLMTFGGGCLDANVTSGAWSLNNDTTWTKLETKIEGLTAGGLTPLTEALIKSKQLLQAKAAARKQAGQVFKFGFVLMADGFPTCPENLSDEEQREKALAAASGLGALQRKLKDLQNTLIFFFRAPHSPDPDAVRFARELAKAASADLYFAENAAQMSIVALQAVLNTATPLPDGLRPYAVRQIDGVNVTAIIDDGKTLSNCNNANGAIDPGETIALRFAIDNTSDSPLFLVRIVADLVYLGLHITLDQPGWNEVGDVKKGERLLVDRDHAVTIAVDPKADSGDSFEIDLFLHAYKLDMPEVELGTATFRFELGKEQGF